MADQDSVVIENARLIFRNFAGKEGQYNREGDRNFAVALDDPVATQAMIDDGWNVKFLKAREEGDEDQPYIQVSVNYSGRPPKIYMITSRGRTPMTEDMVALLDWADITNADLIMRPYHWDVGGRSGIKAYLQSLFVTVEEDELERKYADVPDAAVSRQED